MKNKDWKKAMNLFSERDYANALPYFHKALKALPNDPDLIHDRAVCYFHLNRRLEALEDLNHAAQIQPSYSYRYSSRAFIKSAMKDYQGAMEDYRKAIELDPDDAIAHNNLGLLEEQMGWNKQAQERFKIADELAGILDQNGILQEPPTTANSSVEIEQHQNENASTKAHLRTMWDALTSSKARKEFISFIKNGFTLDQQTTETEKEKNS